jgi:ribulose-5-phosphate 4-epimerase/fuculose-1-phosphate aldolase
MTTFELSTRYAERVARAVRVCVAANVMDFNGHASARDENDPNVMWINNRHASRSTLTAAEIVPFDIAAGRRIGEGIEPPSEWYIHADIYKRRPEIRGVVHSHPEFIRTLTTVGQPLQPIDGVGAFLPENGAPLFDTCVLINTPARGEAVANAIGGAPMLVLRQHGAVTVGTSVEQAVIRMICAEQNAKMQIAALGIGEPRYLRGEEHRSIAVEANSDHAVKKFWTYYEETARTLGAFKGLES